MQVSVLIPLLIVLLFFIRDKIHYRSSKGYYDAIHDIKLLDEEISDKNEAYKQIIAFIDWIEELHNRKI